MKKIITLLLAFCIFVPQLFAASADTELYLKMDELTANKAKVSIHIKNPSAQQIMSVQSWLKYDPEYLQGEAINTTNSAFDFVAPGENTFDQTEGLVKIGRSSISGGSNESDIFVAEVTFKRLKPYETDISFYNFKVDNSGNTSVRVFEDGFPVNVLKEKPKAITLGEGEEITITPVSPVEVQKDLYETARPQNVKITSGPGYAILSWDKIEGMKGYNLYYSNASGRYLQRRGMGNTNEYYIDGLETGKYYYFALKAYDSQNRETKYSNEVRVKIGYPDTSSSPLYLTQNAKVLEKVEEYVEVKHHANSGPAELLFFGTIIAGILSFLFVKRRKV